MAEATEEVSKPEVDKSEETVEDGAKFESTTAEAASVASMSAAGDAGSVATDNAGEPATADLPTEAEKQMVDTSASIETVVVSEDDPAKGSVVSADADVTVASSDAETDKSKESALQTAEESITAGNIEKHDADQADTEDKDSTTDRVGDVEEKPDTKRADGEVKEDATTDRVELVTSKADKVTVSVEIPKTGEVSEGAVVSSAVTLDAAAATKSEASDTAVNKTTQDVMKMAGNDELKFGVLIGLVHVGQFSNKDVVDSVLCLVSTATVYFADLYTSY